MKTNILSRQFSWKELSAHDKDGEFVSPRSSCKVVLDRDDISAWKANGFRSSVLCRLMGRSEEDGGEWIAVSFVNGGVGPGV